MSISFDDCYNEGRGIHDPNRKISLDMTTTEKKSDKKGKQKSGDAKPPVMTLVDASKMLKAHTKTLKALDLDPKNWSRNYLIQMEKEGLVIHNNMLEKFGNKMVKSGGALAVVKIEAEANLFR